MKKKAGQPSVRHEASEVRSNQLAPVPANRSDEPVQFEEVPVDAYFVHDDLHALMAHRHAPIFTMMQKDDAKAWLCMFFSL